MKPSRVEVDAELAERAEQVAASRGESVDEVIARALLAYVGDSWPESTNQGG
jgi:hypothetical protein